MGFWGCLGGLAGQLGTEELTDLIAQGIEDGLLIIDEQDGIRPHVKFFVNKEQVRALDTPLAPTDEVHIMQALSGG